MYTKWFVFCVPKRTSLDATELRPKIQRAGLCPNCDHGIFELWPGCCLIAARQWLNCCRHLSDLPVVNFSHRDSPPSMTRSPKFPRETLGNMNYKWVLQMSLAFWLAQNWATTAQNLRESLSKFSTQLQMRYTCHARPWSLLTTLLIQECPSCFCPRCRNWIKWT